MAEFLLELFSEEIPANLQSSARVNLLTSFKKFFEKENINYKGDAKVFSTPNRLVLCFKKIDKDDWVFSSWRNHYHALLHGFDPEKLFNLIVEGRSMGINSLEDKFYSSSIVGGSLPIALGVAQSIKLKKDSSKVWCFIGDMTFETGTFHECYKYSRNFDLPIEFVVEDNNMSTNSPTDLTWNKKSQIPDGSAGRSCLHVQGPICRFGRSRNRRA